MSIKEMLVGQRYLYGDSLGYAIGICTRIEPQYHCGNSIGYAVWVKDEATGKEDFLFETPNCPFVTYVENR